MIAGRKRAFEKEVVLGHAMKVFWSNGFSGSSMCELTEAMGINKPSLYSAFGNKETLFLEALKLYFEKHVNAPNQALFAKDQSLEVRVRNMLRGVAELVCDPKLPGGCFFIHSLSESAGQCLPESIVSTVNEVYINFKSQIIDFFKHEQALGNISNKSSAKVLMGYLISLQLGIANMGRSGVTKKDMHPIIEHALLSFDFKA